ncbi:FAD-dependent oxidoreductase [bacterium]|nr:FAD-dependent oxidoreductase [bacterium]
METGVLIIGAGLAGLSAGYHLDKTDHVLVEAEERVGGLCKSFFVDGFHFDCTGHLIHFRTSEGRQIITGLVGDRIQEHQRKSAIYIQGRYTDYPFQANTYGLPREIIKECVLGFAQTLLNKKKTKVKNFQDWIQDTFGDGIARHFMVPYNEKLWQHDLGDIALDWVNWSIPKPSLEDVLNGALGIKNKQFGYNPVFYYPSEGGIGLLPESFPIRGRLLLSTRVTKINLRKKEATLSDGCRIRYGSLFSTMPLHALLQILEDAPANVTAAHRNLQYVSVLNVNLGIDRPNVLPYHWVYYPEKDKPFYRIGCTSNFSSSVSPPNTSCLYIEISLRSDREHDVNALVSQTIASLRQTGILTDADRIVARFPVMLPYAYVVYNSARKKAVEHIQRYLKSHNVHSFGRYGSWVYSSMEDAVLEGKQHAEQLLQNAKQ